MQSYKIKKAGSKGKGLFATRNIKKGEKILHCDLTKLKSYSLKEIKENPKLQSNHCDYVGHSCYAIDFSSASYINHSCDPNCVWKYKTIKIKDLFAMRDIKRGEELTVDMTASAIDQFGNKEFWVMSCKCGSKNCRKRIHGNLLKMPASFQKMYYPYLPKSIRIKYKIIILK